jgi:hypothetical protein
LIYHFLLAVEENSHQIVEYSTPGSAFTGSSATKSLLPLVVSLIYIHEFKIICTVGTFDSLYDGEEDVVKTIGNTFPLSPYFEFV